jgi:hypothetical protein
LKGAVLIDVDGNGGLDALAGGVGFNDSGIETWINENGDFELRSGNIPFSQFGAGTFAVGDVDMDLAYTGSLGNSISIIYMEDGDSSKSSHRWLYFPALLMIN